MCALDDLFTAEDAEDAEKDKGQRRIKDKG